MATFYFGSTPMPEPAHGGASMSLQDVDGSSTGRLQDGTMTRDRVTQKIKWNFKFPPLTGSQLNTILTAINVPFFSFTYPNPYSNTNATETKDFYCGDRSAPIYWNRNGTILWEGLSVNFIEK